MKRSWSYRLFFEINESVGKNKLLDRFMLFCAHDLLYILAFVAFMWATTTLFGQSPVAFNKYVKLLMTAGAFGIVVSWSIGFIAPHARPIVEYPKIKQLLRPLGTWKSFPSDHTIAGFTLAMITWLMGAPIWFGLVLVGFAVMVGVSRVYVGVHYPRDIVGGIIIAFVFSSTSFWLLEKVSQPLYDGFSHLFL